MRQVVVICLAVYALCVLLTVASVAAEKQAVYDVAKASGTFECFDRSKKISFDRVNDDYCDCPDGSDEPDTSACSMLWGERLIARGNVSTFKCAHTALFEQTIPSHWVNDGLCDCCDGSDEPSGLSKCPNSCGEAARDRAKRQEQEDAMRKTAAKVNAEMRAKAAATRNTAAASIPKLKKEAQSLEGKVKDLEKLLETLEEKEAASRVEVRKALSELEAKRDELSKGCVGWRQTGNCDPRGPREAHHDKDCLKVIRNGHSGYCECGEVEAVDKPKSAQVDDEGELLGDDEGGEGVAEPVVRNRILYNFTCEHEGLQCASVCRDQGTVGTLAEGVESPTEQEYELQEAADTRRDLTAAKEQLAETTRKITELQDSLSSDLNVGDLLRTLEKQSFKMDFQDYTYELILFDGVWQNPKGGSSGTSIGKWKSFAANTYSTWAKDKYDFSQMLFADGTVCFNGIVRSTEVHVVCGSENKLVHVEEPSMCRYKLVFETPAICEE